MSATVAVGVPVFNEISYVRDTIATLKSQTGRNFTSFISDNCSTDGTYEIARQEIAHDPRFRLVQHPRNMGALFNFAYLMDVADTDYFMWLGGHDRLSSNAIQRLAGILDADPDTSMAMAYPHAITKDGTDDGPLTKAVYHFCGSPIERYIQSVAQLENCTIFHAMFRREKARRFRFEPVLGSDHPFISMLLWHGRLVYDKKSVYYRRVFPSERSEQATQMERVTGIQAGHHSWEGLVDAYVRSFSVLYGEDRDGFAQARKRVFDTLVERFGLDPRDLKYSDNRLSRALTRGSTSGAQLFLSRLFRSAKRSR